MRYPIAYLLAFLAILQPTPIFAWSEAGHFLIALMAYDHLGQKDQQRVVEILKHHPRFVEDFKAPSKENDPQRWQIGHMGYWADQARKQPKYNRPNWHYEIGSSVIIGNKSKMRIPTMNAELPRDANLNTPSLHLTQAIELCKRVLKSPKSLPEDKAIALCWIAHLVADAHQPCHAGSLYMEKVFEHESGDRGGNSIQTKQKKDLHALWDQLLGERNSGSTKRRMQEIMHDSECQQAAALAVQKHNGLETQTWLAESRALAMDHVYTPPVIASLSVVARGLAEKNEPVDLPIEYLKNAGRIAQIRAAEGSIRLAKILELCLVDQ
jgi:hypothetical protein